jgi:hypothetical protein
MNLKALTLAAAVCVPCVEWTRLAGTVKNVNLRDSTVTIQNKDGDLLTIPIDYQVSIVEKHDEIRTMKSLKLDEKITLTRVQSDKPKEDTDGLAPPEHPEPPPRGR